MIIAPGSHPFSKWLIVIADGVNITKDCFFVDTETRKVSLYLPGEGGRRYAVEDGSAASASQIVRSLILDIRQDAPNWIKELWKKDYPNGR